MQSSLYVKYGSRITTGISELVYDRLLADPDLAPFFVGVDVEALRDHMADFLGVVTGGPDIYRGRDIRDAHHSLSITNADLTGCWRILLRRPMKSEWRRRIPGHCWISLPPPAPMW
jgi:truncated hemoglobin YjbI